MMSLLGVAIGLYGTKEITKGIYKKGQKNNLERKHETSPSAVLKVIGGEKYLFTQTNAIKQRYINYLHHTYGLSNEEKIYYEKKFNDYVKLKKHIKTKKQIDKVKSGISEYHMFRKKDDWKDIGNSFKINLERHCARTDVDRKMKQTINNNFLKEVISKSWTYDGKEILQVRNVNSTYKRPIRRWYKNCWIKEFGSWTY